MPAIGYLHSYETFGALDGPGVRFVAFLQGCPLRCLYCHNPDTWCADWREGAGYPVEAGELVDTITAYRSFYDNGGGVTLSGGEPLMQAAFCTAVLRLCKAEGLHTALDTGGSIPLSKSKAAIDAADLIILDIKALQDADCKALTGQSNQNALNTLAYCEQAGKPVWIRQVLVPLHTLNGEKVARLGEFLKAYRCIERVELLPYHKMGDYKWEESGITPPLVYIPEAPLDEVKAMRQILHGMGLPVIL